MAFEDYFERIGRADTLELGSIETSLRPQAIQIPSGLSARELPILRLSASNGEAADLSLGDLLGEGGMGMVLAATQPALGRTVAAKLLKPGRDERAQQSLIAEAMTTGQLEHPNIVPVHLLGKTADGHPVLVMKKVDGVSWQALLTDPGHAAWRYLPGDRFEWSLRMLIQVADAVHFAHEHGIIHRDLKPANVMIGRFGEVYVVDWGIALALPGEASADIVGTPAYMPPEMLCEDQRELDRRTDVYLLGGMLYRLLTGGPPHRANTIREALAIAGLDIPKIFPPSVSREVAALATRALKPRPQDRFESAAEFKRALLEYLEHRGAVAILEHALHRTEDLVRAIERTKSDASPALEIYQLFGECRFGFQEAKGSDPEMVEARDGWDRCLRAMIAFELDRKHPLAAQALAAELSPRDPALDTTIVSALQLKERQESELKRLSGLEHDLDVRVGARTRAIFSLSLVGAFIAVGTLAVDFRPDLGLLSATLLSRLAFLALVLLSGFFLRRSILLNAASRRLAQNVLIAVCALTLVPFLTVINGMSVELMLPIDLFTLAVIGASCSATFDRRFAWPTAWLLAATAFTSVEPAYVMEAYVVALLVMLGMLVLIWLGRKDARS